MEKGSVFLILGSQVNNVSNVLTMFEYTNIIVIILNLYFLKNDFLPE